MLSWILSCLTITIICLVALIVNYFLGNKILHLDLWKFFETIILFAIFLNTIKG